MERVTFNGGASYWEYNSPERLAEIIAFVNREQAETPFSPQRCVNATLRAERDMFQIA